MLVQMCPGLGAYYDCQQKLHILFGAVRLVPKINPLAKQRRFKTRSTFLLDHPVFTQVRKRHDNNSFFFQIRVTLTASSERKEFKEF